jgi:hypothetical protein
MIIVCLFLASCFGSSQPEVHPGIITTGYGTTFESAKQHAFKQAIDQRSGVLVLSDKKAVNSNLVKNELFEYNSGYVKNYKVISHTETFQGHSVRAEVWVSDSQLFKRILSAENPRITVNGTLISTQHSSTLDQRRRNDQLFVKAMETYPKNAYDITNLKTNIYVDAQRNSVMDFHFNIRLNKNFLGYLTETLTTAQDKDAGKSKNVATILLENKPEGKFFNFNSFQTFYFRDRQNVDTLMSLFQHGRPVIKLEFQTNDGKSFNQCYSFPDRFFYGSGVSNLDIRGEIVMNKSVRILTTPQGLQNINEANISVDSLESCNQN